MRHLARAVLVLAFAGTASIAARAQQPQRSGAGDLDSASNTYTAVIEGTGDGDD